MIVKVRLKIVAVKRTVVEVRKLIVAWQVVGLWIVVLLRVVLSWRVVGIILRRVPIVTMNGT